MLKKMLIVCNSTKVGGAEISLLSLLDSLAECYQVTLILPYKSKLVDNIPTTCNVKFYDLKRIKANQSLYLIVKDILHILIISTQLSFLVIKNKVDIIYSNSVQAHIYCVVIRILTFKKNIWHVRDNIKTKFEAKIYSLFSYKIICISKFIYDQIPCARSKKTIIYNGIDTNNWMPFPINKSFIKTSLKLNNDTVLIGQIGQLVPWKRHIDIVKVAQLVMQSVKNVHFLFIGNDLFDENSNYILTIKKYIELNDMGNHFTFLGYKEDIINYINELNIVIHCAESEPFGRAIIECMSLEKPVVAYNSGAITEIVVDKETGFLSPLGDINSLSNNLIKLVKNKALAVNLGKIGRQNVIKKFSLYNTLKQIKEFIK